MRRLLLACLLLGGCDRAEIDPIGTGLLTVSPELDQVQLSPDLTLQLQPPDGSGALTVRVENTSVPFDSSRGVFVYQAELGRGLNRLRLDVTNEMGTVERDTLYALYLPLQAVPLASPNVGLGRADAAATSLPDQRGLITGGVGTDGRALASASIIRLGSGQVLADEITLRRARAGHTASAVAGGTLLLGGATEQDPAGAGSFVGPGEWIRPDGTTQEVEVEGGVSRAGHSARVLTTGGVDYVYLFGGLVPSGAGVAASGTIDVFEVVPTDESLRLARLSPAGGSGDFEPVADHVQVETSKTEAAVYGIGPDGAVSFRLVWSRPGTAVFPFSLGAFPLAPLVPRRSGAASVDLGGGLGLILGGRDGRAPLDVLSVYAAAARRTFDYPPSVRLAVPRSDATATILRDNRIVVGGGRSATDTAIVSYEVFRF